MTAFPVEVLWKIVAWVVARKPIANYLIRRAQRTPYFHLDGYMNRWWLFNAYSNDEALPDGQRHNSVRFKWLPSIRIHHILREDAARDMHDHPWDARTIILKGSYVEERLAYYWEEMGALWGTINNRYPGDTATLKFGEYHNITSVSEGGVWTLFFTWKYMGTWGFFVNGRKIPHREYVNGGAA